MRRRSVLFSVALGVALATLFAAPQAARSNSGCTGGCGTVFVFDLKTLHEKVLYSFDRKQGYAPVSGLAPVGTTLYGTTGFGGAGRGGTVFSIDRATGAETLVHAFAGDTDGFNPASGMIKYGGLLYGTTLFGGGPGCGGDGCGTVYSINPQTGAESVVYAFQPDGTDGTVPQGELIGIDGLLFGTTVNGGATSCSCGTVFSVDPATRVETIIYPFEGGGDGGLPYAGLTDVGGMLYGTTSIGGHSFNGGILYSVDPATGVETDLYRFERGQGDGYAPHAKMTELGNVLYGTTTVGGDADLGTVYSFDPGTAIETVVHSFENSDGYSPGELINAGSTLYGTTAYGGADNSGTIFTITTSGELTTLYAFDRRHGAVPLGSLHAINDKLYGTTAEGGKPD